MAKDARERQGGADLYRNTRPLENVAPGARGEVAVTRESFFEQLQRAFDRIAAFYTEDLRDRMEAGPILEAEERMEAAARAADYEAAGAALAGWERAWLETITARGGKT
jgi:hypothetical protein